MTLQIAASFSTVFNKEKAAQKRAKADYMLKLNTLKENIEITKYEIGAAMNNFNNVCDPKLIDFYIYKIQSEQNRFEQLLIEYKELERKASAKRRNQS